MSIIPLFVFRASDKLSRLKEEILRLIPSPKAAKIIGAAIPTVGLCRKSFAQRKCILAATRTPIGVARILNCMAKVVELTFPHKSTIFQM